jgi:choline dehydrogenase-like flavoprotein
MRATARLRDGLTGLDRAADTRRMERVITTDVCVVGAGPAGSILAHALAKGGKQVVLIEQGPAIAPDARASLVAKRQERLANELEFDFNDDWPKEFRSPPIVAEGKDKYSSHSMPGLGGMALHWNGMSPRPLAEDFKVRTLFGYGRDYPITYEELEPWLLRAEHEMGIAADQDSPYASPRSGPFPMPAHKPSEFETDIFAPAVRKLGWVPHSLPWAINSRIYDDRSQCLRCRYCVVCPSGARYSPDLSHIRRLQTMPNATILTETKLLRLESKTSGGRVVAAHGTHRSGEKIVVKADRYVLAMGGIETPRMLLLSTDARNKDGFGNAGGQVGVGFADKLANQFTLSLERSAPHTYGYPTMWTEHHRANAPRREHGSMTITFWPHGAIEGLGILKVHRDLATTNGVLSLPALHASLSRGVVGITFIEATENNRLVLDPAVKDAWGLPVARTETALTDRDRASLAASDKVNEVLAEAMGAEAFRSSWQDAEQVLWESHPTGGAAMATSPERGACDPNAKVFGLENLYLVSSAMFPHNGANNPTLTICAFALRLAAHLGAAS